MGEVLPKMKVWHYLNHPEHCGTSKSIRKELPLRIRGEVEKSGVRAFGIHFEERPSVLMILVPVAIVALAVLITGVWYFIDSLNRNPDDLQNASVPLMIGMSFLAFAAAIPVSLLTFRWTMIEHG